MVSAVISSCFFETTCSAPASGLSAPERQRMQQHPHRAPGGGCASRCADRLDRVAAGSRRRTALTLKNCASRPERADLAPATPRRAAACRGGPGARRRYSCRRAPVPARWPRRTRCSRPESAPTAVCSCELRTSISLSSSSVVADVGSRCGRPACSCGKRSPHSISTTRVAVEQLVEPERRDLARARPAGRDRCGTPRPVAVFVNQGEGRAGDFVGDAAAPSPCTMPLASVVFPAPRLPISSTTRAAAATRAPGARPARSSPLQRRSVSYAH